MGGFRRSNEFSNRWPFINFHKQFLKRNREVGITSGAATFSKAGRNSDSQSPTTDPKAGCLGWPDKICIYFLGFKSVASFCFLRFAPIVPWEAAATSGRRPAPPGWGTPSAMAIAAVTARRAGGRTCQKTSGGHKDRRDRAGRQNRASHIIRINIICVEVKGEMFTKRAGVEVGGPRRTSNGRDALGVRACDNIKNRTN